MGKKIDSKCLTPKEKEAVENLIKAVKQLPNSICFDVKYDWINLFVYKRIPGGFKKPVATLRKYSICKNHQT